MKEYPEIIMCKKCYKEKAKDNFSFMENGKIYYYKCKDCIAEDAIIYYSKNKDKIKQYRKKYYVDNKDKKNIQSKNYYQNNKEKVKEYVKQWTQENIEHVKTVKNKYTKEHKDKKKRYDAQYNEKNKERRNYNSRKEYFRNYENNKLKTNTIFNIRKTISAVVNQSLKFNNVRKNGKSIIRYLPFTMEELKMHLELLFEPWMNWNNRGKYLSKKWNDDDCSTWTWNIDHIIPQSDLPYLSMEDENFKKCWSLDNLRPYSAKQNVIDGVTKTRHNKGK